MKTISPVLWNNLYDQLLAFVYSRVKDKPTAEDIVQDVFIKAQSKSYQLKEEGKVSSWIFQITRNAIADHYRKLNATPLAVNLDTDNDYNELNDCVAGCLNELMHRLPLKYRIALELTEYENLSQFELADRLQISYSGARSRVQRARKMLKEKLEELYIVKTDQYGNVIVCENKKSTECNNC